MTVISVVLALLAAVSNATSNVLQRKANMDQPSDAALSLRLLGRLAHRPVWLAGIGAVTVSFLLQASALRAGALVGVQPIIVLELPFTLFAAVVVLRARVQRYQWLAVAMMVGGLVLLLAGLDPTVGASRLPSGGTWFVGLVTTGTVVGVLVLLSLRRHGPTRAALLGCATGVEFGMTAALMKGMTATYASGLSAVFTSWTTYAMVVTGIGGMFLLQNALQAGRLVMAQPGVTLLDPVTAVLWGVLAFNEHVSGGMWRALAGAGMLAMAAGAVLLGRSLALVEITASPGSIGELEPAPGLPPSDRDFPERAVARSCRRSSALIAWSGAPRDFDGARHRVEGGAPMLVFTMWWARPGVRRQQRDPLVQRSAGEQDERARRCGGVGSP